MASFTRIVGGLNERVSIPVEDSFQARRFSVSREDAGWRIAPRGHDSFADTASINGYAFSAPRPLRDDDLVNTLMDRWVFHDGPVARDEALERAAVEQGGASWEVLADWLAERGDPLGERINANRGMKQARRPFALTALGWTNPLNEVQEDGVIRTLTLRSVSEEVELLAKLTQRRARFLERLAIDSPLDQISSWVSRLESWPLPRWIRSLELGNFLGPPPNGLSAYLPTERLRTLCPMLRAEPLISWNATPTLTLESHTSLVDGLEPGARVPVTTGLKIERRESRVVVHDERARSSECATFTVAERHCILVPTTIAEPIAGEWLPDELSRTKLLHDDLIEAAPGVVFRFRLRD